jgi:hypothetical protein
MDNSMAIQGRDNIRKALIDDWNAVMAKTPPLELDLAAASDQTISVWYRIAKTRLRLFFADPRAMIMLRAEHERREKWVI